MDFSDLQKLVYQSHTKTGHAERWKQVEKILKTHDLEGFVDLAQVGLFTSEVGEVLEEVRNKDDEKLAKELAGLVIRIMNFANRKGIMLETFILKEHERNMTRENLHGRKLI